MGFGYERYCVWYCNIIFGIAISIAFSSMGLGYSSGTKIGLGISFLGFLFSAVSYFVKTLRGFS